MDISNNLEAKLLRTNIRCLASILIDAFEKIASRLEYSEDWEYLERMTEVQNTLKISRVERDLLDLLYQKEEELGIFDQILRHNDIWRFSCLKDYLPGFLNIKPAEARKILRADAPLLKLGLLNPATRAGDDVSISDDFALFLAGTSRKKNLIESMFEVPDLSQTTLQLNSLDKNDWNLIRSLLAESNDGVNILFYGEPGTGKTSLAKALAKDLEIEILGVKSYEDGDQDSRIGNLQCALSVAEYDDVSRIVLVDEADQLLCTAYSWRNHGTNLDKGWLNKTLEKSLAKTIWITNSIDGIESSTLRRFSFSIEFKNFTNRQRYEIWKSALNTKCFGPQLRLLVN